LKENQKIRLEGKKLQRTGILALHMKKSISLGIPKEKVAYDNRFKTVPEVQQKKKRKKIAAEGLWKKS